MADFQLTSEADSDLLEIARYTMRTWGEEQVERYESKLRGMFESIACGRPHSRVVLKSRPELLVSRCDHHYVFYRLRKSQAPLIIAVLHVNMDLMNRLRS